MVAQVGLGLGESEHIRLALEREIMERFRSLLAARALRDLNRMGAVGVAYQRIAEREETTLRSLLAVRRDGLDTNRAAEAHYAAVLADVMADLDHASENELRALWGDR